MVVQPLAHESIAGPANQSPSGLCILKVGGTDNVVLKKLLSPAYPAAPSSQRELTKESVEFDVNHDVSL